MQRQQQSFTTPVIVEVQVLPLLTQNKVDKYVDSPK